MNEIASVPTAVVPTVGVPDFWFMMLKSIGMLCIVIALLIGVLFIFKQITEKRGGKINKNLIKLLSSLHVAPKERVMLLDVMGKKILIGVTQQSINCLAVLDGAGGIEAVEDKPDSGFKEILEKTSHSQITAAVEDTSAETKE